MQDDSSHDPHLSPSLPSLPQRTRDPEPRQYHSQHTHPNIQQNPFPTLAPLFFFPPFILSLTFRADVLGPFPRVLLLLLNRFAEFFEPLRDGRRDIGARAEVLDGAEEAGFEEGERWVGGDGIGESLEG